MKKIILTVLFSISLLPMSLSWFGGARGVQEIKGLIVLYNPVTILSIVIFFIGLCIPFKNKKINNILSISSLSSIILVEIYTFMFWHYKTIDGKISLNISLHMAYPEFYFGLAISIIMLIIYCTLIKKQAK